MGGPYDAALTAMDGKIRAAGLRLALLGRRGGYRPSEEGEEREGGVLLDEPVHRGLKRVARKRVPRTGHRRQIRRDPVCQGVPDSRRSSPGLGPLSLESMGFAMGVVGGGAITGVILLLLSPSMLSIRPGGCLVRHLPVRRHWGRHGGAGLRLSAVS